MPAKSPSTMIENCGLCKSPSQIFKFRWGPYNIVECGACSVSYIKNPISPDAAREIYDQHYGADLETGAAESLYSGGENFRLREAESRLDNINRLMVVRSLLDVGCGLGHFLMAARRRGITVRGQEISRPAAEYAREQGLDVRLGDLLDSDLEDSSFDAVTLWASIEHLYHPAETVGKIRRLLKPGGMLAVETGDINSLQAKLFGNKWRLLQQDHNFYFSSASLEHLLERNGFKVLETDYDGFVEGIVAQFGLSNSVLRKYSQAGNSSQSALSEMKEMVNRLAGRLHLGDVMIKYCRKEY